MQPRKLVTTGAVWESVVGYSRAVRIGGWIAVSGTTAASADGGPVGGDDIAAQAREVLSRIRSALEQAGATTADVVRTRMFVTDIARWAEVAPVHSEFFADVRPASTMVEVSALIDPALLIEIEADAYIAPNPVHSARAGLSGIDALDIGGVHE